MATWRYHFEEVGKGEIEGPNDPSAEHFSGVRAEESLAREMIQNALDARSKPNAVVEIEFELRDLPTSAIPDIAGLSDAIERAIERHPKAQGTAGLRDALASAQSQTVPVLRIGDYGTKGLTGSESDTENQGALAILTRSRGLSSGDGQRGGSFGIGSASARLASRLRTVSYVSKPMDSSGTVYASTTQLASFDDQDGVARQAAGHFLDADAADIVYQRDVPSLAGFNPRVSDGTDVYVLDYRPDHPDPELISIRNAVVENFMVAIHVGNLVVRGIHPNGEWVLDSETIGQTIDANEMLRAAVRPFYLALTEGTKATGHVEGIGQCQFYVRVDTSLEKKLGTQLMRSPLMRVQTMNHAINIPYAAIFMCTNSNGNELLRSIEPPQHDNWNDEGPRSNQQVVRGIRRFIRNRLREALPDHIGDSFTVEGLADLLPSAEGLAGLSGSRRVPSDLDDSVAKESGRRLGHAGSAPVPVAKSGKVHVEVLEPGVATPDGQFAGKVGERSGDSPTESKTKDKKDGPVDPGDGKSRIRRDQVHFRSFAAGGGMMTVLLRATADVSGRLDFVALTSDGGGEQVDVEAAWLVQDGEKVPLGISDQGVSELVLVADQRVELSVRFAHADRYRLGVARG